jgi:hypothetical protein
MRFGSEFGMRERRWLVNGDIMGVTPHILGVRQKGYTGR